MYSNEREILKSAAKAPNHILPVFKTKAGLDAQVRSILEGGYTSGVIFVWCEETKQIRSFFIFVNDL